MEAQHQFDFDAGVHFKQSGPCVHHTKPMPAARSRATDPETSHEAAAQVEASGVASAQRSRCLAEVLRQPGQTCGEIAIHIGLQRHAVGRRLPELRDAGLVKNGGARICSEQGSRQMTWEPA